MSKSRWAGVELDRDQLIALVFAARSNAGELLDDSRALLRLSRNARAHALAVLALARMHRTESLLSPG